EDRGMTEDHLTSEQLSALLDGALPARAAAEAERHVAGCASCRDALAALGAQEESLRRALTHDPGDAYFATFAERVSERIRAGERRRGAGGPGTGWGRSGGRHRRKLARARAAGRRTSAAALRCRRLRPPRPCPARTRRPRVPRPRSRRLPSRPVRLGRPRAPS